jgi:hypothetical protein
MMFAVCLQLYSNNSLTPSIVALSAAIRYNSNNKKKNKILEVKVSICCIKSRNIIFQDF